MIDGTPKRAFYFGCIGKPGHYFHDGKGNNRLYMGEICKASDMPPAWAKIIDGGLLKNGKRPDVYDGKVFAVPASHNWIAFVWWDNSVDTRGASNSGFYVHGFDWDHRQEAFEFACAVWPKVVARQKHLLTLVPK